MKAIVIFIIVGILLLATISLLVIKGNSGNGNTSFNTSSQTTPTFVPQTTLPQTTEQTATPSAESLGISIASGVFANSEQIPTKYTCDGQNINPPLIFSNIPVKTVSLALSVRDPDATSGTFTHWIVWNIDPKTARVVERATIPGSTHGTNDAGKTGYTGPCPPSGTHNYIFTLYSLDAKLNLTRAAKYEEFQRSIQNHVIEQSQLIGLYTRQ